MFISLIHYNILPVAAAAAVVVVIAAAAVAVAVAVPAAILFHS
jgi:hypothetical protein